MKIFSVGFIGVEPNRSWAAKAHLPALHAMKDRFRIAGIANSNPESSRKAADALGIEKSFLSVDELVASADVDIVAITVKVPNHFELVSKALTAGKHVYCEWPLGTNLDEAERLDQLATEKGVRAVIGTQALGAPAIRYIKRLVGDGYVGKVLSVSLLGNGGLGGAEVNLANAYTLDALNGATLLSIPFGHTVAALRDIFGDLHSVSARLETRRTSVKIIETGEEKIATAPDQVLVSGVYGDGIPFSAHYRGGSNAGTGLLLEISGTDGTLQITGPLGHLQIVPLSLAGAQGAGTPLAPLTVPEQFVLVVDAKGPAANVAALYARLYSDLTAGTNQAPTFSDAVGVHRLLAAIEAASASSVSQQMSTV